MYISVFSRCVQGFTAGSIIAFMCFKLLPQAFDENKILYGIFGLTIGTAFTVFVENLQCFKSKNPDIYITVLGVIIACFSFMFMGKVSSFLLTFAAGQILYVCCGMILPMDCQKAAILSSILGFVATVIVFL